VSARELVLYGRPGCHLCDEARELLEPLVARSSDLVLREVDIESGEELLRRYLERIPVITLDGSVISELVPDPAALESALLHTSPRMSMEGANSTTIEPVARRDGAADGERLSLGVAARLSRYLQVLIQARKMGKETISSQELADYTHINSTQIRRDLSGFGKFGKRGVGYRVDSLVAEIRKILRTSGQHNIALFGAGHLGRAIATSDIFADHGFQIVAIFDVDPKKVGQEIGGVQVRGLDELERVVSEEDVVVGVLAVPASAAQDVADRLVESGVKIIFNYSERLLQVPPEVTVHTSSPAVDLLYALYFYLA